MNEHISPSDSREISSNFEALEGPPIDSKGEFQSHMKTVYIRRRFRIYTISTPYIYTVYQNPIYVYVYGYGQPRFFYGVYIRRRKLRRISPSTELANPTHVAYHVTLVPAYAY